MRFLISSRLERAFGFCFLVFASTLVAQSEESLKYRYSYALGYELKNDPILSKIHFEHEALLQGLRDGLVQRKSQITPKEAKQAQIDIENILEAWIAKTAEANKEEGGTFLVENAKKPGVISLESGLQYRVLRQGNGKGADVDSNALIRYRAKLLDGTPIDFSFGMPHPIEVTLAGSLVPGLTEGILLMREGASYEFFIESDLAYGDEGNNAIPPGVTLIVVVDLVQLLAAPDG